MSDVTHLLLAIDHGNVQATEQLFQVVYDELRQMARQQLAREQPGQTLQPTALVHEAWLRLMKSPIQLDASLENKPSPPAPLPRGERGDRRRYFFAAAAEAMRRILIEQARRKLADKRGGLRQRIDLDSEIAVAEPAEQLLELHEALDALARLDARKAELVKMRYFLGMSVPVVAAMLNISQATAERDWAFSRAWLYGQLQRFDEKPDPP